MPTGGRGEVSTTGSRSTTASTRWRGCHRHTLHLAFVRCAVTVQVASPRFVCVRGTTIAVTPAVLRPTTPSSVLSNTPWLVSTGRPPTFSAASRIALMIAATRHCDYFASAAASTSTRACTARRLRLWNCNGRCLGSPKRPGRSRPWPALRHDWEFVSHRQGLQGILHRERSRERSQLGEKHTRDAICRRRSLRSCARWLAWLDLWR